MAKQPFVPVPGVVRIRFNGTNQGSNWVNGFAVQYTGLKPDSNALNTFATSLRTLWTTHFAPLMHTGCTLRNTQVWDITDDQGASGLDVVTVTGTKTGTAALPCQAACAVSWPVNKRWRGGHFRTYLVAAYQADIVNGRTLASAYQTAITSGMTAFRTAVNATVLQSGPVTLCGVRYFPTGFDSSGKPLVKTSGDPFPFQIPVTHQRLDTQRRRLGKEIG